MNRLGRDNFALRRTSRWTPSPEAALTGGDLPAPTVRLFPHVDALGGEPLLEDAADHLLAGRPIRVTSDFLLQRIERLSVEGHHEALGIPSGRRHGGMISLVVKVRGSGLTLLSIWVYICMVNGN